MVRTPALAFQTFVSYDRFMIQSSLSGSRVVICGAGVAGLAAAALLADCGWEVLVVERADTLRDGGYAVDFRGDAMTVLDRLGLLEDLRGRARGNDGIWYVDRRGHRTARLPGEIMGGDLEVGRGDLLIALRDRALEAGAQLVFGASIASIWQRSGAVTVQLEGSLTCTVDAAVLIGADGLHSRVRHLTFGSGSQGVHALGYIAAVATVRGEYAGNGEEFCSVPGATVGVGAGSAPGTTRAVFYFADPGKPVAIEVADPAAFLRDRFEGHGWLVPQLLDNLVSVDYFDTMCRVELPRWTDGRTALLGDAAWCASPLSGMGTTLALLGAYALTTELTTETENMPAALSRFEDRMRGVAAAAHKLADGAGAFFIPGSRLMIRMRDLTYRTMRFLPWRNAFARVPDRAARVFDLRALDDKLPGR
jgi:2-polyprenyl-6-methoxyphenol hydroxylase-like FAD-dependent oxidoreductase